MQKQKGFISTTIILIIVGIIIIGGGTTYLLKQKSTDNVDSIACTEEAKKCPDGFFVNRIAPDCKFAKCPDINTGNRIENQNSTTIPIPQVNELIETASNPTAIESYVEDLDKCLHLQVNNPFGINFEEIKGVFYENLDDCLIASEISYHPNCYLEAKDTCYSSLGEQTGNLKYCEMVEDTMEREKWCYYEIAYKHKNSNACEKITTTNWRDACFNIVASLLFDRYFCDKISNKGLKEDCLSGLCWLLETYNENPDGSINEEILSNLKEGCQ